MRKRLKKKRGLLRKRDIFKEIVLSIKDFVETPLNGCIFCDLECCTKKRHQSAVAGG